MKKISARILALLLTVVMVLGVVPFAAADGVSVPGEISGPTSAWAGTTVGLTLTGVSREDIPDGYTKAGVRWETGFGGETYNCKIPADATGSYKATATLSLTKNGTGETETVEFSHTISIKTPAGSDFAITGGAATAKVGQAVKFDTTGENDSDVAWSVEPSASISGGKFKATEAGTYTITATAKNGSGDEDDVTDTATITVEGGAYFVTMSDRTISVSDSNARMSFTVKDAEGNAVTEDMNITFHSDDTTVVDVDNDGYLTPYKAGTAGITVIVEIGGETCTDEATVTVVDKGAITCPQDYSENSGDSVTMHFTLNGVSASDVKWTVSVSGDEDFSTSALTENGNEASVRITADDGIGVATVRVNATWGTNGSASAVFYTSFYEEFNRKVVVKEDVDEFDFDENGVFKSVSGAANASKISMHSLLTDGCGTDIILSESSSSNYRAGEITYKKSSSDKLSAYDPDEDNDYATSKVGNLHFEVKGEGQYKLNVEIYKAMGYSGGLATSKGTITIVTGGGSTGDITYSTVSAGSVKFKAKDFDDFWTEQTKKSSSSSVRKEDLNYVSFDVATTSELEGKLKVDGQEIKSTWKFADTTNSSKKIYDLDDLTYYAANTKGYEDFISFICYGENNTKIAGVVCVEVGSGKMSFTDVKSSDWFYDHVSYVCSQGVMNGTTDTTFAPGSTLTRGMVVTMLWRLQDSPVVAASASFTDVKAGQWYADAVAWAAKNGVVNGTSDTTFSPEANITRQDLALMLYRYAKYAGYSVSGLGNLSSFSDQAKVGSWATEALQWAVGNGIVTGSDGKLNPTGTASRAEAAAMFARFMQNSGSSNKNDKDNNKDKTVYVARLGFTYHYDEECAGKNCSEKELSELTSRYSECVRCVENDIDRFDDDTTVYLKGVEYHLSKKCAGNNYREKEYEDVKYDYDPCRLCAEDDEYYDEDDDDDDDDYYEDVVYITPSGSKYHYDEDCAGSNASAVFLEDVEDDYDPCRICAD